FFVAEPAGQSKFHICTRRTSVNWTPEALAQRLVLISMSVANVVGALRCELGVDPANVEFKRPASASAFRDVWSREPAVRSIGIDALPRIAPEDECSREELLQALSEQAAPSGTSPDDA